MIYLHNSPIGSHGNLKTANCLVDSRWVVKISDFGLHQLKSNDYYNEQHELQMINEAETELKCQELLWRAPELIRDKDSLPQGTQKGDVYSVRKIIIQ